MSRIITEQDCDYHGAKNSTRMRDSELTLASKSVAERFRTSEAASSANTKDERPSKSAGDRRERPRIIRKEGV
jgi:hypothetical protein